MKIYNSAPNNIGRNLVITNTEQVRNRDMFFSVPPATDIYKKLADEMGMFLIKVGANRLVFRSEEALKCGEFGQNHLDLNFNYDPSNHRADFDLGLYRLICANGLEEFETMGGLRFNDILRNKIDVNMLINALHPKIEKIEHRLDDIQEVEIIEDEKEYIVNNLITQLMNPQSIRYLSSKDNMKQSDIKNMLNMLTNSDLLKPNRSEDAGNNLWNVFNTVQENTMNIVNKFKSNTKLENKILLDTIKPLYVN